ncbi:MAG: D-alanyl-D-alanine carboxypeptidase/D-alanyl-D-alanine-endopeptidase [Phycisphaerae bacterium]
MRSNTRRKITLLLALAATCLPGPALGPARAELAGDLRRRVEKYEESSGARVGLRIVDLAGGRTILDRRAETLFIPASNQKLVASAAAIAKLGGDYEFRTVVAWYEGDLYLAGSCDPTLGDPVIADKQGASIYRELDVWAGKIKAHVGETFDGRLILLANPPAEDGWQHPKWSQADKSRWYGAPVSALNFHNNCYDVTFSVSGEAVIPHVSPSSRFIKITDRTHRGRRQIWSLRGTDDESSLTLRGTVRTASDEPISSPAKSPPLLLGRVLADRIGRAGVQFNGQILHQPVPTRRMAGAKIIATHATPIADVLGRSNKDSLNLAAECLLLRAGNGTWSGSARQASSLLQERFGLSAESFVISDGSGLSRANRISPAAMVQLLAKLIASKAGQIFLDSLPVAGVDGSLDDRMTEEDYKGRTRAKTGYILGVSCLSGYITDKQGKAAVAFSILVNDVPPGKAWVAKQMQDDLCRLLVDHLDK